MMKMMIEIYVFVKWELKKKKYKCSLTVVQLILSFKQNLLKKATFFCKPEETHWALSVPYLTEECSNLNTWCCYL